MSEQRAMGRPKKHDDAVQICVRVPQWVVDMIDDESEQMEQMAKDVTGVRVRVSRADVILRWATEKSTENTKQ